MRLHIPYVTLHLISYKGAGNKTPVLNLDTINGITDFSPKVVRKYLENNEIFRKWLQNEGKKYKADSIMMYYKTNKNEYDFVTFVGEPNTNITDPFSDMCGNGIRSLALHIFLEEQDIKRKNFFKKQGIKIWAGSTKYIQIQNINREKNGGMIEVDVGKFKSNKQGMNRYMDYVLIKENKNIFKKYVSPSLSFLMDKAYIGYGLNSSTTVGEPHVVLLYEEKYLPFLLHACTERRYGKRNILFVLRHIASLLGAHITFNKQLFPRGINLNIAIKKGEKFYIATHERNILPTKSACYKDQHKNVICRCVTNACGTGGAALANIAYKYRLSKSTIITRHTGGEIIYKILDNTTIMIGSAEKCTVD